MGGIDFDLAPEPVHIDLEQVALTGVFFAPNVLQQQILRDDAANILAQVRQQAVLNRSELKFLAGQCGAMLREINVKIPYSDGRA